MIPPEDAKVERKLRRLEMARVMVGIAAIAAVLAVVFCGIGAFTKERDAWLAMRLPAFFAVILVWSFARTAKAIVELEAIRCR